MLSHPLAANLSESSTSSATHSSAIDGLTRLMQAQRQASEYAQALETARRILELEPANERAHQQIMLCLVALGKRNAALEQYNICANEMQRVLGTAPSAETNALYEWLKQSRETASLAMRQTNLPIPDTKFVGRAREITELKNLLTNHGNLESSRAPIRLVTLVGAGGSGKTRLAIRAATELMYSEDTSRRYKDGVWWVDLSALYDPSLVVQTVAQALAVRELANESLGETLGRHLAPKFLLLVLDNCDHLTRDVARLVVALLSATPSVRILATSREPLGVAGEYLYDVPPLSAPPPNAKSLIDLFLSFESVHLFVECARKQDPSFTLDQANAFQVAAICQLLHGAPLAIELAAAQICFLAPSAMLVRLQEHFQSNISLSPERILSGMLDCCAALLSEQERALFYRLSVFAGSWSDEAAREVVIEAAEQLSRLIHSGLIRVENETPRYSMLETIAEYARKKLGESDETDTYRRHHAEYFSSLAHRAAPALSGAQQAEWLNLLDREQGNLRAALHWLLDGGDPAHGLKMTGNLWRFWWTRGDLHEGRKWHELALAHTPDEPSPERATALQGIGVIARTQGDYTNARRYLEASAQMSETLGDLRGQANVSNSLGLLALELGEHEVAREQFSKSLELERALGNTQRISVLLNNLGGVAQLQQEYAQAKMYFNESRELREQLGDRWGIANSLVNLGEVARLEGDAPAAREFLRASLALRRELGDKRGIVVCLEQIAALRVLMGELVLGAQLFGAAEQLRETLTFPIPPVNQAGYERDVANLHRALPNVEFMHAWNEGRALTFDRALELAERD